MSARGLATDRRGAVMVVAVFMSAFLVGGLWYLIGIGDAVLYRERMQDGADAVAYAAAVYHARGMNLIAMINLIMAAILGVLVAMKLLQVMNAIANVVSCSSGAISLGTCAPCDAVCALTSALESPISSTVQATEQVVKATLPVLSKLQVTIAVGMPWVAEGKSLDVATQYKKPVESGATLGSSLVAGTPVDASGRPKLGLPVREGDYAELCKKAGEFVGKVAFAPFGGLGDWVASAVGGIVSSFPSYFCAAGGAVNVKAASDPAAMRALAQQQCDAKKNALSGLAKKLFSVSDCVADATKSMTQTLGQKGAVGGAFDATGMTPKVVIDDAVNGNDYFQVWSAVVGDDAYVKVAQKGVEIANWNKGKAAPPPAWGRVGFAQAEFYYAPKAGQAGRAWADYRDETMWNMRWRARLRRFHPPGGQGLGGLVGGLGSQLLGKLDSTMAGALSDADALTFLMGGGGAQASTIFGPSLGGAQSVAENPVLDGLQGLEVIH